MIKRGNHGNRLELCMIGPLPVITNSIPIPLSMPNPARTDHFLCQPDSQQLSDGRAIHYLPSLISFLSCRTQMNVSLLRHGRQHAVSRHFPPHYPFHDVLTIVDFFFLRWRFGVLLGSIRTVGIVSLSAIVLLREKPLVVRAFCVYRSSGT